MYFTAIMHMERTILIFKGERIGCLIRKYGSYDVYLLGCPPSVPHGLV
jgi:hypothetical protein